MRSLLFSFLILRLCLTADAGQIADQVWSDNNANGIFDAGDTGIPEVEVKLYLDHNRDGMPERVVKKTRTGADGGFVFDGLASGTYAVGIHIFDLPPQYFRLTAFQVGDAAANSDVHPGSLRTRPIRVTAGTGYSNIADAGFLVGDGEIRYRGTETHGQDVRHIWTYQDIRLEQSLMSKTPVDDGQGGQTFAYKPVATIKEVEGKIRQLVEWLSISEKNVQTAANQEDYLDTQRTPVPDMPMKMRIFVSSPDSGSYSTGALVSQGSPITDIVDRMDDFGEHYIFFYENSRGVVSPILQRASWATWEVRFPHIITGGTMYLIGQREGIGGEAGFRKVSKIHHGIGASILTDGLESWEGTGRKFTDVWSKDRYNHHHRVVDYIDAKGDPQTVNLHGGGIQGGILCRVLLDHGIDKLYEVITNISQKNWIPQTPEQAMIEFSQAVNDATDGAYKDDLVKRWGMPAKATYDNKAGTHSGAYVERDLYRWDFAPHTETPAAGHGLFSERTTEGVLRWTSDTDWICAFHLNNGELNDDIKTPYAMSIVKFRKNVSMAHQVKNGTWEVAFDVENTPPFSIEAEGVGVLTEFEDQPGSIERLKFRTYVDDGELEITLRQADNIFTASHISGMTLKYQGEENLATPIYPTIGVNFGAKASSTVGGERYDSVQQWTDAVGTVGKDVLVKGGGTEVLVSWEANNIWQVGSTDTVDQRIYHGYLDDLKQGATVTFRGLKAWMGELGLSGYRLKVYRSTDSTSFSDVQILAGDGALIETLAYPTGINQSQPGGGTRAVKESSGDLAADAITIDPTAGPGRGTIAAVAIIGTTAAAPGGEAK